MKNRKRKGNRRNTTYIYREYKYKYDCEMLVLLGISQPYVSIVLFFFFLT